jgi:NADH-quinone oxidoreductase subunit H
MMCALMSGVLIPWGETIEIGGKTFALRITDINIGVLYVFGVVSLGVYGLMIGGWSSNNKFSLMGAMRASSQVISYELSMGMALISVLMITGSLNLTEIVKFQTTHTWMVVYQPLGFLIFIVCAFAECNRTPFDLAECETELVGGYHTEYSGMKLGFYLFAEYINMFVSSAMMATLFFGGYDFPGRNYLEAHWAQPNMIAVIGIGALFAKIFFFIFFYMWVRWTIPRFRYDQLMNLGWKTLIPLSIVNLLLTGGIMILKALYF